MAILFGHLHPSIQLPIQQLPSGPILGHGVFPALKGVFQAVKIVEAIGTCGKKPPGTQSRPCSAPAFLEQGPWRWGANPRWYCCNDLVGCWTNPSEKYDRQIGSFPQVGVKIKKYLKPPPSWFIFDYVLNEKASWKCRKRCEKTLWKTNMAGQCASFQRFTQKGISNQLAVFFTKIPYSYSTKMSTQVLKELLCPPTREPPPKHIWDMVALWVSAHSVRLSQSGAFCPLYISALLLPGSSSFELFWRDVFFWNRLKGGRFGFGARNEVILVA